ncbi:translation initiation factor IF-3 [Alphaproteobacteria bacterium endosymbiont of Tiliacea citrago]|uniref:translation initiation factor IF-3 n=1 Tax=Alphaproteobacteria bacterium endosymbiont of Tiliacea citrago TaxID=3077944 RepID=UPI00313C3821
MRIDKKKPNNVREHKINKEIRSKFVFLIDKEGNKIGNVYWSEAMSKAEEDNMDLVQIAENAEAPVCKIMDYGRFCFEQKKSKKKAKKDQKMNEKKEIKMNPAISANDLSVKIKKIMECLTEGYKVMVLCVFKGRQIDYPEIAMKMMEEIISATKDLAKPESDPKLDGKRLILNLNPIKK